MAALQVLDNTDTSHNYKNTNVMGHQNRTSDSEISNYYEKSIFGTAEQEGERQF